MFPLTSSPGVLDFCRCISLLQGSPHNALTLEGVEKEPVLLSSLMGETLYAFMLAEQTELPSFLSAVDGQKVGILFPKKGQGGGGGVFNPLHFIEVKRYKKDSY